MNKRMLFAVAAGSAVVTLAIAALLTNIFQKKQEARNPFYRVVELTDTTIDPAVWGKNFPLQYDDYQRTVDMVRTRYGGSEALPRVATPNDPRTVVAESRLEEDPRLVMFFAGYAFSKDFRLRRGHAYMLEDQMFTGRQQAAHQPGSCLQCHGSMYVPYQRVGNGDIMKGFQILNAMGYMEAKAKGNVTHPISCIDCHDPSTMQLRVTRPGFMNGIKAYKASLGVKDYDVNRDATRQEMRTYVCGQCHVEYYFKGPDKQLTYPWFKGLQVDSIYAYYQEVKQNDWVHAISGAGVLKAQHPEFEMHSQGIHGRSNVACADCHMPYKRTGALKISDHHVRSPLLNVDKACQTCHRWSEDELRARVNTIQDKTYQLRNIALDATLQLTEEIGAAVKAELALCNEGRATSGCRAREAGALDSLNPNIKLAREYQRKAQFFADFVEAENSMGFHADQEAARILGNAINFARLGEAALRGEKLPEIPKPKYMPGTRVSPKAD